MNTAQIRLVNGRMALVDADMLEKLGRFRWYDMGRYAATIEYNPRRAINMARFVLDVPSGLESEHKNLNGFDNRRENLRVATRSQNLANRSKTQGCSSRYKGVTWQANRGKWKAQIRVDKEYIYLGLFTDERKAAEAYNAAAVRRFGEFARVNVLMDDVSAQETHQNRPQSPQPGREVRDQVVPQHQGGENCASPDGQRPGEGIPHASGRLLEVPLQEAQGKASGDLRPQRDPQPGAAAEGAVHHHLGSVPGVVRKDRVS
jgi:hypothetical protein